MLLISLQERICCVAIVDLTLLLIIIASPSAEVLGSVEVLWVVTRGRIFFLQVTVKSNSSQDKSLNKTRSL